VRGTDQDRSVAPLVSWLVPRTQVGYAHVRGTDQKIVIPTKQPWSVLHMLCSFSQTATLCYNSRHTASAFSIYL